MQVFYINNNNPCLQHTLQPKVNVPVLDIQMPVQCPSLAFVLLMESQLCSGQQGTIPGNKLLVRACGSHHEHIRITQGAR